MINLSFGYGEIHGFSSPLLFLGNGEYQPQILEMHRFSDNDGLLVLSEYSSEYLLKLIHYSEGKASALTLDETLFFSKIKSFVDLEGNYHLIYFNSTADINHVIITRELEISYVGGFRYDPNIYNMGAYDVLLSNDGLIHFLFNVKEQALEIHTETQEYILRNARFERLETYADDGLIYFQLENDDNVTLYRYDLETGEINSINILAPNFLTFGLDSFPNGSIFSYIIEKEDNVESFAAGGKLKVLPLEESFASNGTNWVDYSLPEKIFRKDIIVEFPTANTIRLTGNEVYDRTNPTRYRSVQYEWINGDWQQNWKVEQFSVSNNGLERLRKVSNSANSFVVYVNGFPQDYVEKYDLNEDDSGDGSFEETGILLISNEISINMIYLDGVASKNNSLLYGIVGSGMVIISIIIIAQRKRNPKKVKDRLL